MHSGISACDAVTIAVAEVRSADDDHLRAADLLEEVGKSNQANAHAKQFRLLVSKKNSVEYQARRATAREARDGVERAARLVTWARSIVIRLTK